MGDLLTGRVYGKSLRYDHRQGPTGTKPAGYAEWRTRFVHLWLESYTSSHKQHVNHIYICIP